MKHPERRDRLVQKLTDILQTRVEWGERNKVPERLQHAATPSFFAVHEERGLWFADPLSSREERLLHALLSAEEGFNLRQPEAATPQQALINWLRELDRAGRLLTEPPPLGRFTLEERVPFYIVHYGDQEPMRDEEISRVLQPFFDGQVWLLPITEREYLVLPLASLIYEEDEAERWRETLWNWAEGLIELFASELGEDIRAVVHPPVETPSELGSSWLELKEAFLLGTGLHPNRTVFATWDMALERLLGSLPHEDCRAFLEDVASESHSWWQDAEMRDTLDMFFRLNLNVSETARQLFLHRNTLLYRLDKLKQETGRDVRQFEDAMLIRLALFLSAGSI